MFTTPFSFMAAPAGGQTLWTPADITTLGWWDASDAATITLSGSNVTQWDDKSGNGYDATQSTASLQPTYGTNTLNGLDVVTFDGTNDILSLPGINYTNQSLSTYIVVNRTGRANQYNVMIVVWKSGNDAVGLLNNPQPIWEYYTNGDLNGNQSVEIDANYKFLSAISDTTGPTTNYYTNGSLTGTDTTAGRFTGSSVFSQGAIGNDQYGSALAGNIGEIVVVDGTDTQADRERMEGYLAWKWGLEGDLPVGHPYKNSPPYVTPTPPVSYLLDTYPGAGVAFSVRKLSSSYTGYCMRIQRSSDNTTQDIGFDGNGYIDTAAITSFVGANSAYIDIWYDQSGNGNNAGATGSLSGFQIVNSGTIKTMNGKVAAYTPNGWERGNGGTWTYNTDNKLQVLSVSAVEDDTLSYNTYGRIFSFKNSSQFVDYDNCDGFIAFYSQPFSTSIAGGQNNNWAYSTSGTAYSINTQYIVWNYKDAGTAGTSKNGGTDYTVTTGCGTTNLNMNVFRLGNNHSNSDSSLSGWIQEVVAWPVYNSGDKSGIVTNSNNFYSTF